MEPRRDRDARPGTPLSLKLFGIGVIAVAAWVALGFVFSIARAAIAALGYVVVAVVAYFIGKFVGRSEERHRDEP